MIGETLYIRDSNKRVYVNDDGTKRSSPDPAKQWVAWDVVDETRDSWVLGSFRDRIKVNKKTMELRGTYRPGLGHRAYTAEQMADEVWREEHGPVIIRLVQNANTATLREIAVLLGYAR